VEWNDERIALLTQLSHEGLSASQVALRLEGVSRSAVIGKVHRLGIAGRHRPALPRNLGNRAPRSTRAASASRRPGDVRAPREPKPAPYVVFEAYPTATLVTLAEHGCRWPIGEPDQADFGFCGRLRVGRGSYCQGRSPMASHCRLAALPDKQLEHLVERCGDASTTRWRKRANG
jgi:GcrA cell cycle regulator